jgi:hypothetical protein
VNKSNTRDSSFTHHRISWRDSTGGLVLCAFQTMLSYHRSSCYLHNGHDGSLASVLVIRNLSRCVCQCDCMYNLEGYGIAFRWLDGASSRHGGKLSHTTVSGMRLAGFQRIELSAYHKACSHGTETYPPSSLGDSRS